MMHNIARGVCIANNTILLAYHTGLNYYFLPGGHVELGESARKALARELDEELGQEVTDARFLTVFEHAWNNVDQLEHEINMVFLITLGDTEKPLRSHVPHLSFKWVPIADLCKITFLPKQLLPHLIDITEAKTLAPFISTID